MICYPTFGGSGIIATELGMALATRGHEVHFITYQKPVRLPPLSSLGKMGEGHLFFHEVSIIDYPLFDYSPYEILLSSKIVEVAKQFRLDLLHAHYAIPHASASYLAKQVLHSLGIKTKVITTLHGTDITLLGKDPAFEPVITFSLNQSNAVTAVSNSLKEDTLKYFSIRKKICVIPNFVCPEQYQLSNREWESGRRKFASDGEKILLHVSNFRKVKRVEDVVRAFEKVKKQIPAKLILIGDGPEKYHIEKSCETSDDLKTKVCFLGSRNEVEKILPLADLFLLTSETESFGLAALEAMAAKVPVISTNTGGTPEVNIHNYSGMLSKVGDVDDMAKNALYILGDEKIHGKFRSNAFEQANKFRLEKILPQYENLYKEVVSCWLLATGYWLLATYFAPFSVHL